MDLFFLNLTLIEYIAVPFAALIFAGGIYFFIRSRRSLDETLEANGLKQKPSHSGRKEAAPRYERPTIVELEEQFARRRYEATTTREEVRKPQPAPEPELGLVDDFKNTIARQQRLLDTYLAKVEDLEKVHSEELELQNAELQLEIDRLHGVIEKKDADIEDLGAQVKAAEKMASRIDDVYAEFEQLQQKMALLEKQAGRANSLAMELEDARQAYEQVHRELLRKQEKLDEALTDAHRMRREMDDLEDKLSEANAQRSQLQKKIQFLNDLNSDMQSMSDTNKKLQTELRRIGELESMLNLMAEERDYLLRKKLDR